MFARSSYSLFSRFSLLAACGVAMSLAACGAGSGSASDSAIPSKAKVVAKARPRSASFAPSAPEAQFASADEGDGLEFEAGPCDKDCSAQLGCHASLIDSGAKDGFEARVVSMRVEDAGGGAVVARALTERVGKGGSVSKVERACRVGPGKDGYDVFSWTDKKTS